jgi:glutamine amidotransferase
MKQLREKGIDELIPTLNMPVLGICLGMQLMCKSSQEEDTIGLGIFPVEAIAIPNTIKVPHMGWNTISALRGKLFKAIPENERMYFVHSYYVPENEYTIARCNYHNVFSAAMRRGSFYGCQFHPEKSSGYGEQLLANFINENV